MVEDLFATPRAGQDVDVTVLANDVEVDADRRDRPDAADARRTVRPHDALATSMRLLPEFSTMGNSARSTSSPRLVRSPRRSRPSCRRCTRRRIRPATIRATASRPALHDAGVAIRACGSSRPRRRPRSSTRRSGLTFVNSDLAFSGKLRLPGQLRRLLDLGRQQPGEAGDGLGVSLHHVAG